MDCSMVNSMPVMDINSCSGEKQPVGFLFEIKKVEKVAGYFLGAYHIVPNCDLENFNSKNLEAFEFCNVLGVEVDTTRAEFIKARNEAKKLDTPKEKSFWKEYTRST